MNKRNFITRLTIVSLAGLILFIAGCGSDTDGGRGLSESNNVDVTFPAPFLRQQLPDSGEMEAYLIVDGDDNSREKLSIADGQASGEITLLTGDHSFQVVFEFTENIPTPQRWSLSRSDVITQNISSGANNPPVAFNADNYEYPDGDGDGFSNFMELTRETNPDDETDSPPIEFSFAQPTNIDLTLLANIGALQATVTIDGGVQATSEIGDPSAIIVSVEDISSGTTHDIELSIELAVSGVQVASLVREQEAIPGDALSVTIDDGQGYTFPDDDSDMFSNFSESVAGSDPDDRFDTPVENFVVFTADKTTDEVFELFKVDLTDNSITKLSGSMTAGGDVESFAISPDRKYVAYIADQNTDEVQEVYVALVDGSEVVKVSNNVLPAAAFPTAFGLTWAPDSSRIAYSAEHSTVDIEDVYAARPDISSSPIQLSNNVVAAADFPSVSKLSWAPDSSRLAYIADHTTADVEDVYTAAPDVASNPLRVSNNLVAAIDFPRVDWLVWAPDSSRLAYIADHNTANADEVYSVAPDGASNPIRVSNNLVAATDFPSADWLTWAPDSSRLAYIADHNTANVEEVYSVAPDGASNPIRISNNLVAAADTPRVDWLTWAPDSSRLAYIAEHNTATVEEAYTAGPTTAINPIRISNNLVAAVDSPRIDGLIWAPDSSRLAYSADHNTANVGEVYTATPTTANNPIRVSNNLVAAVDTPSIEWLVWAPDSSRLAYVADHNTADVEEAYSAAPTTANNPIRVSNNLVAAADFPRIREEMVWTVDNSRLAYIADHDTAGVFEVYVARPNSSASAAAISGAIAAGGDANVFDVGGTLAEEEPNNTLAQAGSIINATTITGSVEGDASNNTGSDLSDIFAITVPATGTYRFTLSDFGQADLDLFVLDGNGNIVASSEKGANNNETVVSVLTTDGQSRTFYVEILAFDTNTSIQSYRLTVSQFVYDISSLISILF